MYKDRGIIKWAPFDALASFRDVLTQLLHERDKQSKPILDEDKLAYFDRTMKEAFKFQKVLGIDYYEDGYFKKTYGYIDDIDLNKRLLKLDTKQIVMLDAIVEMTLHL